jgi:hypothetical protein
VLDPASGALVFDRGAVEPGLTRRRFLRSPLARRAKLDVANRSYRTYALAQPLRLDERVVAAELSFEGESLREVSLALVDARFGTSWDDWSQKKELARKAAHTKWLRTFLDGAGPRWTLSWGVVESTFDPKGGGSSISIIYGHRSDGE